MLDVDATTADDTAASDAGYDKTDGDVTAQTDAVVMRMPTVTFGEVTEGDCTSSEVTLD